MTSMTWSPAQKALTTPSAPAFLVHAWTYVSEIYVETTTAINETLGSVGLQLGTPDRGADDLSSAIRRDIGRQL